jgi:TatA/E family protein of Tat protein translocase
MGELLVILVIALLVLGPKKLPDVATTLGKAIRQFRKATQDLTDQLQVDDEVKRPLQELKAALRDEPEPHHIATQKVAAPKPAAPVAVEAAKPIAPVAVEAAKPIAPVAVEAAKPIAPKTEKA